MRGEVLVFGGGEERRVGRGIEGCGVRGEDVVWVGVDLWGNEFSSYDFERREGGKGDGTPSRCGPVESCERGI